MRLEWRAAVNLRRLWTEFFGRQRHAHADVSCLALRGAVPFIENDIDLTRSRGNAFDGSAKFACYILWGKLYRLRTALVKTEEKPGKEPQTEPRMGSALFPWFDFPTGTGSENESPNTQQNECTKENMQTCGQGHSSLIAADNACNQGNQAKMPRDEPCVAVFV